MDSRVLFGALAEVFTALVFHGLGDEVFGAWLVSVLPILAPIAVALQ